MIVRPPEYAIKRAIDEASGRKVGTPSPYDPVPSVNHAVMVVLPFRVLYWCGINNYRIDDAGIEYPNKRPCRACVRVKRARRGKPTIQF